MSWAETRHCTDCGRPFQPRAHFHRLCIDCFKRGREDELRHEGWHRGYAEGFRKGKIAGALDALHTAPRPTPALDAQLLGELIRLVHPDRHPPERYETANRVTATLVSMRDEARAAA
jgi:hypothetical protein